MNFQTIMDKYKISHFKVTENNSNERQKNGRFGVRQNAPTT